MRIVVNGKPVVCAAAASMHDLVLQLGLKPETVVAERNHELVPGGEFSRTLLEEGDSLELLHFVGGG